MALLNELLQRVGCPRRDFGISAASVRRAADDSRDRQGMGSILQEARDCEYRSAFENYQRTDRAMDTQQVWEAGQLPSEAFAHPWGRNRFPDSNETGGVDAHKNTQL